MAERERAWLATVLRSGSVPNRSGTWGGTPEQRLWRSGPGVSFVMGRARGSIAGVAGAAGGPVGDVFVLGAWLMAASRIAERCSGGRGAVVWWALWRGCQSM